MDAYGTKLTHRQPTLTSGIPMGNKGFTACKQSWVKFLIKNLSLWRTHTFAVHHPYCVSIRIG